ncbi:uncharacterized protein EV420DRAFT_1549565 [Desarmillaria tabescens]|uniref:Uncharacterized protein n=1 Tax=Armillaria tabescens TaxID=1929756 RepID=A0AA39K9V4_ARMTA|nr:uncharacterized protein EV420DRAFT_1549565 [Desarmillaria tabescens]KAK0457244.1 hypothetical protein EV420DRAFT_1549565 [Desarmillaria tabescens]
MTTTETPSCTLSARLRCHHRCHRHRPLHRVPRRPVRGPLSPSSRFQERRKRLHSSTSRKSVAWYILLSSGKMRTKPVLRTGSSPNISLILLGRSGCLWRRHLRDLANNSQRRKRRHGLLREHNVVISWMVSVFAIFASGFGLIYFVTVVDDVLKRLKSERDLAIQMMRGNLLD